MWIFCGGMFRSGSTLQFQIASHLVEDRGLGRRVTWHRPDAFDEVRRANPAHRESLVFKAHGLTPAMREEVEKNGARVLTVHRDIRDVVVSAMRKNANPFRKIWRNNRLKHWTNRFDEWAALPGALVARYDELVASLPHEVHRIASHLGLTLRADEAESIAEAYRIDRQIERTEAVRRRRASEGKTLKFDPHSLLHHNHIASGSSGAFRQVLSPAQIRAIEDECGEWMARWGYLPDRPALTSMQRLIRLSYWRVA